MQVSDVLQGYAVRRWPVCSPSCLDSAQGLPALLAIERQMHAADCIQQPLRSLLHAHLGHDLCQVLIAGYICRLAKVARSHMHVELALWLYLQPHLHLPRFQQILIVLKIN